MEYMYKMNQAPLDVQRRTQGRLVNVFRPYIPTNGFTTAYLGFPNALASREPDFLRETMRKYLYHGWTWSAEEKARNQEGYFNKDRPEGYSPVVHWLARVLVAFLAGAWVIVPIIIMTVPGGSKTEDLIVLSVAVIILRVSVS